jgi:ubiquinone/menaquinone biosynthesis C-methylase UbiE
MIRFRRSRIKLKILLAKLTGQSREVMLRHQFNLCAEDWAENLEPAHKLIAEKAWQKMGISASDRILELGCGDGWASCMMASRVGPNGLVVGLDISDEMVRRASAKGSQFRNVNFVCGSAEKLKFEDNLFTKVFSLEAFYYFEHQEEVLRELLRVMAPLGRLYLVFCLYKDYPEGLSILDELSVPVQVRSASEYKEMLQRTGWSDVQTEEFLMEYESGRKPKAHAKALFISASKPKIKSEKQFPDMEAGPSLAVRTSGQPSHS